MLRLMQQPPWRPSARAWLGFAATSATLQPGEAHMIEATVHPSSIATGALVALAILDTGLLIYLWRKRR
jgi:hypothetical protein